MNGVEWVKQERTHLAKDEHFDERYKVEVGNILTSLFGTPDHPKFPFLLGDDDPAHALISMDNLRMASGPAQTDKRTAPRGLFREHCAHCHGISGDGLGPTANQLSPYPRDFRMGKFKFKTTPLRQPPPDQDLHKIIENGIPGTAMPSFRALPPAQIQALVDYVKYLSIRGEFERMLLREIPGLDGESLLEVGLVEPRDGSASSVVDRELFDEQLEYVLGEILVETVIDRWLDRDDRITKIPPAPVAIDPAHPGHTQFVGLGRELFYSKGNCRQCHGDTGVGDGQLNNFDDWTTDWKNAGNVDPNDPDSYREFSAVGALPPRPIRPRNLNELGYRGGDRPDDLYLRIANGIEGTPMPASTALSSDEIWALVAFVRSLPYGGESSESSALPVNDQQVLR